MTQTNQKQSSREQASILIVDDLPFNLLLLENTLNNAGYNVITATSGQLALTSIEDSSPDLILLDIMMPEMDGYEVCARLKSSPVTTDIPVIFLTAKTETDDIIKGFELGAVDYVAKPFNPVELLARVKTHLEVKFGRETILRQANDRKELLHILCHDLMNPISALKVFFNLIDQDETMLSDLKEDIVVSIENSIDIIEMVRHMRALEEKKMVVTPTPLALSSAVQEARSMLLQRAEKKHIDIQVDIDNQLHVLAEKVSFINSVLNNILSNAVKFSFARSRIKVSAWEKGEFVVIAIKDSGIGMSTKLIEDVFDLTKTTSREGTDDEPGTGFGMPLVKKFVTAYGGDIEIFSKEKTADSTDHGTEIRIRLKRG